MKLSFIVITYKRGELLQECLDSIYAQEQLPKPYEIILVDNGGDAQVAPPQTTGIDLRIIRPEENKGVAGGRNLGMSRAQGQYWVFIDDDAAWHETDAVARLMNYIESQPQCGALALKSVDITGKTITSALPHPDKKYLMMSHDAVEVPYFYGVGHVLRASAIQKTGDYPERYFYGMEEPDLSLRLIDNGYTISYLPQVAVYHAKSNLGRSVAGHGYWYNMTLNKSRMAWRLLPMPYPLTTLLVWGLYFLVKTRNVNLFLKIWHTLWAERKLLAEERRPVRPETLRYLRRIGARLLY